jgi:hypothetical protein
MLEVRFSKRGTEMAKKKVVRRAWTKDDLRLNAIAFIRCCFSSGTHEDCAIAFSKMKSNLIKSALSPLLCVPKT